MSFPKRSIAIAAVLVLSLGTAGCSGSGSSGDGAATAAASPPPVPDAIAGQTLWKIAGTDESLPDDDPDVQAVRTLVTVHSGAVDDRAPETIERSLEDEFSAYTPGFSATLDGLDWRSASIERTVESGVVSEQAGLAWLQSSISADRRSATAQYESYIVFTAADDTFFEENGIEQGREYSMSRLVSAEMVDGRWLISDVRESSLRPRGEVDD